jgi:hypothetical protein
MKVKPYELIPGHEFEYSYGGTAPPSRCRVDRVLIDSPAIVMVVVNGGSVLHLGRSQELELINQTGG